MYWMLLPYRRYVEFSGRSRPLEFWMFLLFLFIGMIVMTTLDTLVGLGTTTRYIATGPYGVTMGIYNNAGWLTALFWLASIIPLIAVTVRRLHDSGKSGWWGLLAFVPGVGWFVLLIFVIMGGSHGPNRFGSDPVHAARQI